ncbi:MAG: hypothetical protein K6L73_09425 [Cellvibrionaceae bacterium]
MTESRDYLEMTFHSINCFANDGKLDEKELDEIIDIATRDGVIDDNEKRVLNNIVNRLRADEITSAMQERIEALSEVLEKH